MYLWYQQLHIISAYGYIVCVHRDILCKTSWLNANIVWYEFLFENNKLSRAYNEKKQIKYENKKNVYKNLLYKT